MVKYMPKTFKYGGRYYNKKIKSNNLLGNHNFISTYRIGLKSLENKYMKNIHINSITRVLKFIFKKKIKIKFNVQFNLAVTKKAEQSRMGKGKGKRVYWVALIKRGTVFLEIDGIERILDCDLLNSLLLVKFKLPLKCKFVKVVY